MAVLNLIEGSGLSRRGFALALCAVLLVATAPLRFAPALRASVPALTVDICHPLQSLDSPVAIALAAPVAPWSAAIAEVRIPTHDRGRRFATRLADSPDTPPPRAV